MGENLLPTRLALGRRRRTWDWLESAMPSARSAEGLPLGLIPGTNYVQAALQLSLNDVVILYTDGITDAKDTAGNILGGDGLMKIVQNLPVESPGFMAERRIASCKLFAEMRRGMMTRAFSSCARWKDGVGETAFCASTAA